MPIPPKVVKLEVPEPPLIPLNDDEIRKGRGLYGAYCMMCHGGFGTDHMSLHPDLTKMTRGTHEIFNDVVLKGAFASVGMASFDNTLSEEDVEAIHQYIIKQQNDLYEEQENERAN